MHVAEIFVIDTASRVDGGTEDSRITWVKEEVGATKAGTVNSLLSRSSGEFICVIEPRGTLAPGAMELFREWRATHPDADVIYADGARVSQSDVELVARPDFSPERLRNQYYFGDLVFYRRSSLIQLGGPSTDLPGAELYDLALRAARHGLRFEHIPLALYIHDLDSEHSAAMTTVAVNSTRLALESHLEATGGGKVREIGADGVHDTRRPVLGEPLISIVIPTRGKYVTIDGRKRCFVVDAVKTIMEQSTYKNFEIVVVIDDVADKRAIDALLATGGKKIRLLTWSQPFNFSAKVNFGAMQSLGEYVLLLNDDIEVITPDWLEAMLALTQLPGAGMAGSMLYYKDETIQHAGHAYWGGDASHIGLDLPRGARGPLDGLKVEREVSGVTAACAMMPAKVFREVGGLSTLLPGNFNDVDLCMKVTWLGYRIFWTPHAELYHFESKTRNPSVREFEVEIAWGRWGFRMHDPAYWPYPLSRPSQGVS